MIASAPQTTSSPRDHATIGYVPWSPRRADDGPPGPRQTSSIPPVPNVILARPGVTQPCPTSDACWSPISAAIGGPPGIAVASPITPLVSTMLGSSARSRPRLVSTRSLHVRPSRSSSPVIAAFDGSVTWTAPSVSDHVSQVSTVPKHRSRSAAPGVLARSQASFVADWFGASARSCSARAARHSPTVRRSCQPSAGPIGSPVARSQTMVLARWLVIPTAVIGSPSVVASATASRTTRASSAASNSTRPGNGVAGAKGRRAMVRMRRSPSTTAARTLVVPTSMASSAVMPSSRGCPGARPGCAAPGRAARPRARQASTTVRLNMIANHRTS